MFLLGSRCWPSTVQGTGLVPPRSYEAPEQAQADLSAESVQRSHELELLRAISVGPRRDGGLGVARDHGLCSGTNTYQSIIGEFLVANSCVAQAKKTRTRGDNWRFRG